MNKKSISQIKEKLDKVNDNLIVYMYDNGYMVEISGRDVSGNYKTVKIMCSTFEDLTSRIKEATELERDE